jgi:prophage regulatory protein
MSVGKKEVGKQVVSEHENRMIMDLNSELEKFTKGRSGILSDKQDRFVVSKVSNGEGRIRCLDKEIDRLIRLKEVLTILPISKSNWWSGVKSGRYPAPVHLGPRITAWRLSEVLLLVTGGQP